MAIVRVGFIELWVQDLERSLDFYHGLLGLRVEHREGKSAYLRGYEELEWSLKLTQAPLAAVRSLGFKVDSEEGLEALEAWARREGLPHRLEGDWGRPRVLRVQDPFGYPLAFYFQAEKLPRVLQRYHEHRGPGILRIDHLNLFSPEVGGPRGFTKKSSASASPSTRRMTRGGFGRAGFTARGTSTMWPSPTGRAPGSTTSPTGSPIPLPS